MMKKGYILSLMIFVCAGIRGQQVIGTFPSMDGGFESLTANPVVQTIPTNTQTTLWTVSSASGTATTYNSSGGRSGQKCVTFGTPAAAANKRLQSPTAGNAAVLSGTPYTVQFYYRTAAATAPTNTQLGINPDGTVGGITYVATALSGTSGVWTKLTGSFTPAASAASPRYGIGILRYSNSSAITTYDVDDYVIYAGAVDNTAASDPGAVTVNNPTNNTLDVSWVAAGGGVDGGGYVVVRYAALPGATDDPLQNGIYAVGNTVTGGVAGTVAYIGTGLSFTDAGLTSGTTYYYKVYTVDKAFNYSNESEGNGTTTAAVTNIVLSSPGQVTVGSIAQGTGNNVIYHFDLAVTIANATLTGVTINTAGTYSAADITNFKCWYSADNIFNSGSDVLLSTLTPVAIAGSQVFPAFTNQIINAGSTGYIFITADIPCAATVANDVSVNALTTADISFAAGTKSGSSTAGGLQTIIAATVNNATGAAASVANVSSSISWTAPAGCYTDVLIVAATSSNTWVPTGTTYTTSLIFGAGDPLGNGFAVYQGNTSPQLVTGLTNGTPYFYKIFTRFGSSWSAGIEVSATPAVVSLATDYFRSVAPGGNWATVATWETSPDNGVTPWIPATLAPTASANSITIRNTADVTVAAAAGGDQLTVDAGATLTLNANFTLFDGAGTDLDVNGIVINTSGTHTITGTAVFNAGSLYQHNRNGGNILVATWATTATTEIIGMTNATSITSGVNQAFGNFIWNNPSQTVTVNLVGQLATVNGNFRVQNCGTATLRLTGTAPLNLTVAGNYLVEANHDIDNNATEVCNISIGGNFSHTVGTFQSSADVAIITMTGVAKTFTQSGGTFTPTNLNWIVNGGASVTLVNNLPLATGRSVTVDGTLDAATLQITGAGDVTVNGTLRTSNTDGLELTGTFANTGTKILGAASTIEYYRAGAQIFSSRSDYANVIINGGGNKTLNGLVTVSGLLTFTNGFVVSTGANLITLTNTASVAGASNASHVRGPIKKIGNTAFTFPVGKINGYVPIGIDLFVGGTVNDEFTAEYIRSSARALGPITAGAGLDHVSACDYWTLDKVTATPVSVDVKGYWSANNVCGQAGSYINDLPTLTMAHFDGAGWNSFPVVPIITGGSTVTAGSITWPVVTAFSPFSLAGTTFGFNPLPITINYFTGTKNNGNHLLNWQVTCVSVPSATIELERSTDGRNYNSIYSIFATALRCRQPFNYTDNQPARGTNYYRLKMTDADGKVTFSSIVPLINAVKGIDVMNIAPNPVVNGSFNLKVSAAAKTQMEMWITDMQGRILQKQSVSLIAGFNIIAMNVKNLAAGTYQLVGITADEKTRVLRFVIQ
jgi:hypothetical protein